jgi:hypothetical protein
MSHLEDQREQRNLERRTALRYICKLKAACIEGVTAQFKPSKLARVNDISTGGLGLHSPEGFAVGTQLTVRLHAFNGQPVSDLKEVRVAHASRRPDSTWILGVAFLQALTEAEVQALLKK